MRACATRRPDLRFERGLVEEFDDGAPWDAIVFLQTIEHVTEPGPLLERFARCSPRAASPTSARRTASRSRRRARSAPATPGTCASTRRRSTATWSRRRFGSVELLGLFHARKLRAHELALRLGWDRVHAGAAAHEAVLRPLRAGDQRARLRAARRVARPRARPARGLPAVTRRHRDRGELCIVLHSHMPYVEGFGTWPFGEEWLLEAMASSYLPLLGVLERHAGDGARGRRDGRRHAGAGGPARAARGRRSASCASCAARAASATATTSRGSSAPGSAQAAAALRRSARRLRARGGRLRAPRRRPARRAAARCATRGAIDLWASCATHAVLPLLATEQRRAAAGRGRHRGSHRARFGSLERRLLAAGVRLPAGRRGPARQAPACAPSASTRRAVADPLDQLEPIAAGGTVAVPIDWSTISLVWDDRGYPADPVYRDYHAQTVNGMRAWANGGRALRPRRRARRARASTPRDFVEQVVLARTTYRAARGRPALVVCALDTELLGHWWYEGPVWLDAVVEEAGAPRARARDAPEALERHEPRARRRCWSRPGAPARTCAPGTRRAVADLVWAAREAELAARRGARRRGRSDGRAPAARRAARELLALQSSDWAFMATRGLAADYPRASGCATTRRVSSEALAALRRRHERLPRR